MYQQVLAIIEGTLKTLGIDPNEAKVSEGQYNISKDKSTEVLLDAWEEHDRVFFQVISPISKLKDPSKAEVLLMLLEENHGLVEASLAIAKDDIIVKETIECSAFFNQERAIATISRIAFYSETYRKKWEQ
ncbi:MAG: hypothetical protein Q7W45_01415 [Bacteroidota bacterium]|nr:hypothetical protein [Bacteroidota bacterium]MDP3147223.1 hypothetical protein [Bacteroidota bacterium]MDP3557703.1 hypothetical protein [Bacteroidota bacterium]